MKRDIKMQHEFQIQVEQLFHDNYKYNSENVWFLDNRIHSSQYDISGKKYKSHSSVDVFC